MSGWAPLRFFFQGMHLPTDPLLPWAGGRQPESWGPEPQGTGNPSLLAKGTPRLVLLHVAPRVQWGAVALFRPQRAGDPEKAGCAGSPGPDKPHGDAVRIRRWQPPRGQPLVRTWNGASVRSQGLWLWPG